MWPHFLAGQADSPIRVLAVTERTQVSSVIAPELMNDSRTLLVGWGESLREGRALAREHSFDVLLVNATLPDGTGCDLMAYCRKTRPNTEVILIGGVEETEEALEAFRLGAAGYLVKDSWFDNIVQAVLQVANGGACLTPTLAGRLLLRRRAGAGESAPAARAPTAGECKLSDREREVLLWAARGMTSPEIARRLDISKLTVATHMKHACQKLQARTRTQAVTRANEWGLL